MTASMTVGLLAWYILLSATHFLKLLHFARVVDDAKCIMVTRVCFCLSVCLSLTAFPHYCTDPNVTWRNGSGCPLVAYYCAELQSVHRFRWYDNIARTRNVSECLYSLWARCSFCNRRSINSNDEWWWWNQRPWWNPLVWRHTQRQGHPIHVWWGNFAIFDRFLAISVKRYKIQLSAGLRAFNGMATLLIILSDPSRPNNPYVLLILGPLYCRLNEYWVTVKTDTSIWHIQWTRKKRGSLFLTITLANLNQFLSFLCHFNREEILHATVVKFTTPP